MPLAPISGRFQCDTGSQCRFRNAYHVCSGAVHTFRSYTASHVFPFGPTEVHLPRLLHRSGRRVGAAAAVTVQARVTTGYPSSQSRAVAASTSPDKARILDYGCRTRPVGEST
jgi:hypothetical protein